MRADWVLATIGAILSVDAAGCHFDSTSGCRPSETSSRHSLDEICASGGEPDAPCSAPTSCEAVCARLPGELVSCKLLGNASTKRSDPFVECTTSMVCKGRRPAGLEQSGTTATFLEAASVVAFARLSHELRLLRAPRRLVRAAQRSRREELRHTRMMRAIERASARVTVAPARRRSILEIAIENAVEGCVRETYGAAVALWQSQHAREHRATFARIARDEARHAVLAHKVDAFLARRLSARERAVVNDARREAIAELVREGAPELPARISRAWLALLA